MKKILLLFIIPLNVIAQSDTLIGNVFYTKITTGSDEHILVSFTISPDAMARLKTGSYVLDSSKIYGDSATLQQITKSLSSEIYWDVADMKLTDLKNPQSFLVKGGEIGKIYLTERGGLTISFTFQSQNDYGNMIFSRYIKDEKSISILR